MKDFAYQQNIHQNNVAVAFIQGEEVTHGQARTTSDILEARR